MNRKKLIIGLAGGVAAFSLVGAGVGASFTDAVAATQSVNAGSMNMGIDQAGGAKSYTLPATAPEGSTFTTGPQLVTTRNNGNIAANAIQLSASDVNNNATFKGELNVEIDSWTAPNQGGQLVVAYNGPLSGLESNPQALSGPVAPGQTDPFYVTFYAGQNGANSDGAADVGYGTNVDNSTVLDSAAQGGTVIPTVTVTYSG
jgi:hypothetical protein